MRFQISKIFQHFDLPKRDEIQCQWFDDADDVFEHPTLLTMKHRPIVFQV